MNGFFNKIFTTIVILILTIVILIVMIWGKTEWRDDWRLVISFFYGVVCGYFIFILWKRDLNNFTSWAKVIANLLSFIVFLVFAVFAAIIPDIFSDYSPDGIDNLNDKSNSINFTEELNDSLAKKHLVIFALDKTKYENTPNISSRYQTDVKTGFIANTRAS